jgi:tRNA threonylcarbamoyladenosine biosynthesis protein TsaE
VNAPTARPLRTRSAAETEALGRALGAQLRPGDVVALTGELGAGKTVLARGIAAGAEAGGHVASPTFTLVREYRGRIPVFHADLYRLEAPDQLGDLGLEELLDGEGIVVIEWAEKARALLPAEYLEVEIRFTERDDERLIVLRPRGARYEAVVGRLGRGTGSAHADPGDRDGDGAGQRGAARG